MRNDMVNDQQQQPGMGSTDNADLERQEKFNELSELSLEERMAVADRIGIPAETHGTAAATGTNSGFDSAAGGSNKGIEES